MNRILLVIFLVFISDSIFPQDFTINVRNWLNGASNGYVGWAIYPDSPQPHVSGSEIKTASPGDRLNLEAYDNQQLYGKTWFFNDTERSYHSSNWKFDLDGNGIEVSTAASFTTEPLTLYQNSGSYVAHLYNLDYTTGGTIGSTEWWWSEITLTDNVTVPTGVVLVLEPTVSLNLNNFSIISDGGEIRPGGTLVGGGAYVKSGSTVKGIYPTISSALTNAGNYETVSVENSQSVSSTLSVTASKTLQVNSGVTLTMASGTRINVYGTIHADGATFQGNGSPGSWNSISLYNTTGNSISSATIRDAECGLYCNNSSASISGTSFINNSSYGLSFIDSDISISGCSFQDNGTAINLYSSESQISGCNIVGNYSYGILAQYVSSFVSWTNNTITGNGCGISMTNSSPNLSSNFISDNGSGLRVSSGNPDLSYNAITCSASPIVRADNGSRVFMGYGSGYGYNSVFGSDLPDMSAYNSSGIYADGTYWATQSPSVYADGTSWILARYPLTSDPNPGSDCSSLGKIASNMATVSEGPDFTKEFWKAIEDRKAGKINEAGNRLAEFINGDYDKKYSPLSLIELFDICMRNKDFFRSEFETLLQKIYNSGKNKLRPLAAQILSRTAGVNNDDEGIYELNSFIAETFQNTHYEVAALYDLISFSINKKNNFEQANMYFERMKTAFPEDHLTKVASILLNEEIPFSSKESGDSGTSINGLYLSNAYPNPFNPSTVISYNLDKQEYVTLIVYDILGKEIVRLMEGIQSEGFHSISFNASGLPSGIYIYQLKGNTFEISKKMQLLK